MKETERPHLTNKEEEDDQEDIDNQQQQRRRRRGKKKRTETTQEEMGAKKKRERKSKMTNVCKTENNKLKRRDERPTNITAPFQRSQIVHFFTIYYSKGQHTQHT